MPNAGHQFLKLNTLKVGSSRSKKKELAIFDYFTDEELEQIQAYVDLLLEIGNSVTSNNLPP
jgi:hypothetical protein